MDISAILALVGSLALLIGFIGGGIEVKEVRIPSIPKWSRFLSGVLGITLIGVAVWINNPPGFPRSNAIASSTTESTADSLPTNEETYMDLWVEEISGYKVKINGFTPVELEGPWIWEWGDQSQTEGYFPQEHLYKQCGTYTVVVTASNLPKSITFYVNCENPTEINPELALSTSTPEKYELILTNTTSFTSSVSLVDEKYVFSAIADRPLPNPADLRGGGQVDFIWNVDADQDINTGQTSRGNDYNIHIFVDENSWGKAIYAVSNIAIPQEEINRRLEEFSMKIEGSYVEILVPKDIFPYERFSWWLKVSSLNSTPDWQEVLKFTFITPRYEYIP